MNVVTDGTDNVNDTVFAISGYVQFCEDTISPQNTIKIITSPGSFQS